MPAHRNDDGLDKVVSDGPPALRSTSLSSRTDDAVPGAGMAEPALAYDYFKSMASVSVATLGGILTLGGTVFGAQIAPWEMLASGALVAVSGVLALQGQTDIVQLCQGIKPPVNSSRAALRLVPAFYGFGLGVFVAFLGLAYVAPDLAARLR